MCVRSAGLIEYAYSMRGLRARETESERKKHVEVLVHIHGLRYPCTHTLHSALEKII